MAGRFPVDPPYVITQGFGMTDYAKSGAYGGGPHTGVDIAPKPSNAKPPVYWPKGRPSKGIYKGWEPRGYGNFVVGTMENGDQVWLAHFSDFGTGEVAGFMGSTGYSTAIHTHFEVRRGGRAIDPIAWLNEGGADMPWSDAQFYPAINQALNGIYWQVYGRAIDASGLAHWRDRVVQDGWDYARVYKQLFQEAEYADRINAGTKLIDGGALPADIIDANRRNFTNVPQLLLTYAIDRLGEAKAGQVTKDVLAKLNQAQDAAKEIMALSEGITKL